MQAIQKPVTYESEQYNGKDTEAIVRLLVTTRVRVLNDTRYARIQYPPPPYETHGYVENGKVVQLHTNDWVVVSSLGVVRRMTPGEYEREFYEDWETPDTVEASVALLAKYVNKLVNTAWDNKELDVDPGDWSKLESLQGI